MPTTLFSVVVFLTFIAPGFYFEQISSRHRTRATESTFAEISRSLVASVGIGIPAGLVALAAWWSVTGGPADFSALLSRNPDYLENNFGSVLLCTLTYLGCSVGLAHGATHILKPEGAPVLVTGHSIWSEVFRVRKTTKRDAVGKVIMKSGHVWIGMIGQFSADRDVDGRELILFKPIAFATDPDGLLASQPQEVVILQGNEIASISVSYHPKTSSFVDVSGAA